MQIPADLQQAVGQQVFQMYLLSQQNPQSAELLTLRLRYWDRNGLLWHNIKKNV
jgi:hypothetical protein